MFPKITVPDPDTPPTSDDAGVGSAEMDECGATELYQRVLRTVHARNPPQQNVLPASGLIHHWTPTSRLHLWRLDRWKESLDRFREAARAGGLICSANDPAQLGDQVAALGAFKWMIRIGCLFARRLAKARRTDWSLALYVDLIRACGDLRREANQPQLRLAIDAEMHLLRGMRDLFGSRKVAVDVVESAIREIQDNFAAPMDRQAFLHAEFQRQSPIHTQPEEEVSDRDAFRSAIYACLLDPRYIHDSQSAKLFRHIDGATRFVFPDDFAQEHSLPETRTCESILDNELRAELHDLFLICETMDARDTAVAATVSYFCVLGYYQRRGFYPENLASACTTYELETPRDLLDSDRVLQIRMAGGEKLAGAGVDSHKQRVSTKVGQPILYSVGPDRTDNRGSVVWDGSFQGVGDWVFPLPAHRRPRHWLQFDLKKALILMTLAAFYIAHQNTPAKRHNRAVALVEDLGGDFTMTSAPASDTWWSPMYWVKAMPDEVAESLTIPVGADATEMLEVVKDMPTIKSLAIYCDLRQGDLQHLRHFPNLEYLTLQGSSPKGELRNLHYVPKLIELTMSEGGLNDDIFESIPVMPSLGTFTFSENPKLTGATFADLDHRFPRLASFVAYNTQINDAAVGEIVKMKTLRHLDLDNTQITDAGLRQVGKLVNLKTLDVQRNNLTDKALEYMAPLTSLTDLYLNETKVDGSGLKHLVKLPRLANLTLDETRLVDKHVSPITSMKRLRTLSMEGTRISPRAAKILDEMTQTEITYPEWQSSFLMKLLQ